MGNGAGTRSTLARMAARRYKNESAGGQKGYEIVSTATPRPGVSYTSPRPASGDPRETLRSLLGQSVSDRQVTALAGARRGSELEVRGMGPNLVEMRVKGPPGRATDGTEVASSFRAERYLLRDSQTGQTVIYNKNLFVDPRMSGRGVGVSVLATQVRQASQMGVSYLATQAGRRDEATADRPMMNGYYRWAQLGYDAHWSQIAARLSASPPASLGHIGTLSDLMATPAGAAWWKQHGTSVDLRFDLTPGSRSRAILNAYLRDHGQEPIG